MLDGKNGKFKMDILKGHMDEYTEALESSVHAENAFSDE